MKFEISRPPYISDSGKNSDSDKYDMLMSWLTSFTEMLCVVLSSIGEDNLSADLKNKISGGENR